MVKKYKKLTIRVLTILLLIVNLYFVDRWALPKKTIDDKIISYGEITQRNVNKFSPDNGRGVFIGYRFFTQKKHQFSTEKIFIKDSEVTIEYTTIFKNITTVKTKTKDYSDKLISDSNGICLYLIIALAVSTIVSLLALCLSKNISENGFINIILLNSMFVIFVLYFMFFYQ